MTQIAIRHPNTQAVDVQQPGQDQAIARLVEWAQAATAAFALAETFCSTQFAPVAYRGKPQEATAAILAGAEVGLSPMAALRAFDNIQGTPAPKAITLRAIVQGKGHEIRIDESTAERAVVSGRRKGDVAWQTSTWTIERAQQMKLTAKDQWKNQPAAMLIARATSEVCRWVASDAIMGMPYSVEELRDEGSTFEPKPPAQRVTAAEILSAASPEPQDGDAQPESVNPVSAPPAEPVRLTMTKAQQGKMHALFNEVDLTDRDQRMTYVNEILADAYGPDRQVESSSELSREETGKVIDKLQAWATGLKPTEQELADATGDVR